MKVKKVKYQIEATVNMGNFSNVKPLYEVEVEVEDGDTPSTIFERVEKLVDAQLEKKIDQLGEELGAKFDAIGEAVKR
jgi:hypothetical protein